MQTWARTIFSHLLPSSENRLAPAILHGRSSQRHCAYACKQCANALFYSPHLNAKEFIQILLRASYPRAPEHYSTKNFVVRPAARSKTTLGRGRTLASNAAMRFFSVTFLSGHTGERLYICKHCDSKHQI